jgi:hypothetical protein
MCKFQNGAEDYIADRGPMVSPAQTFGSFPSTYEQEVSYNYSSAPGMPCLAIYLFVQPES